MNPLFRTMAAALLALLATAETRAAIHLTSHLFAADNLPYVWTDEALPPPYRLRVKIGGSHHATSLYNNNWTRLESVPAPGTYLVELYWVLYDPADWTTVRQIGPFTSGTITIQAAAQPPYARSVNATPTSPGQATTLTGAASDGNGDLAWLHFFTNDPLWRGYVHAGSAYVGARADATASIAWTVSLNSPTGTYQAHLRAADATGRWDWNGGANAGFSVRAAQPAVYSQNATGAIGMPFAPTLAGGAGTGPWQWVVAGRTNWGGSQPGTLLPPANVPASSWVPDAVGDYYFWVIRQGDASYLPSNIAGPYLLTVRGNPPVIVAQPAGLTVNAGESASFSVTASGDAPLSYQWTRHGTPLPGATHSRLVIAAAQTADAGGYAVTVRNPSGVALSATAGLTVRILPPVILTQPAGQTVNAGQSVTLQAEAGGSPPFSYQWLRDGAALPGATNATLHLPNVQIPQAGGYALRVSNAAGIATSATATLSVLPVAPVITRQPVSQTAYAGQSIRLEVTASGSEPLAYQWRRNGVPIAGATLATLTFASLREGDAAAAPGYSVVISNAAGSVASAAATLSVSSIAPIRLALQYWRQGDYPNRPTGNGTYVEEQVWVDAHEEEIGHWEDWDGDGFEETWVVDGYQWVDAGWRNEFTWREEIAADGLFGSRWETTTGRFGPPATEAGSAVTEKAVDRGHALEPFRLEYSYIVLRLWALAPAGNCRDFRYGVLTPSGAQTGYAGNIPAGGHVDVWLPAWIWGTGSYRVELAYSGANSTALTDAKVTYALAVGQNLPPTILQHPAPAYQQATAGTSFTFSLSARDATSYQWFKDGQRLTGATAANLTIGPITENHAGLYHAIAFNAAGSTTSTPARLEVTGSSSADADADGVPDSIERLLGTNAALPATNDSANATLRLRIHQP